MLFLVSPLGFVLSLSLQDIPQTPFGSLGAEQIGFSCSTREVRYTCSPLLYTGEQDSENFTPLKTEFSAVTFGRLVLLV